MPSREDPPPSLSIPTNPIHFIPAKTGELIHLGPSLTLRIMEDGSNTDNRFGAGELIIAPNTTGPPAHWHEMHDETFLVTKGAARFHTLGPGEAGDEVTDAQVGDYVVAGIRAPHTFSNPWGVEARMFSTVTPAFYINYFKLMAQLMGDGPFTKEVNMQAMASYATIPVEQRRGGG